MIVKSCRLHTVASDGRGFPRDGFAQVAFMGGSNVGKSSLINRLVSVRGLARTSKAPGRTQAIFFYLVNERLYFVDLPGYGYARVPGWMRREWKGLVESYLGAEQGPGLSILLVDARRSPSRNDLQLAEWLTAWGLPYRVVLTKADKLPRSRVKGALECALRVLGLPPERIVAVSSLTGDGIPALWRTIEAVGSARRSPFLDHPSTDVDGLLDRGRTTGADPLRRQPKRRTEMNRL